MKTTAIEPGDLAGSVIAVPPLARQPDLVIDDAANRALIAHLKGGGVTSFLYGGNANLYNVGLYEYASLVDAIEQWAAGDCIAIPSVGPAFGTMMDQAAILRERSFPTAMVLPAAFAATPVGVVTGIRRFAERFGRPIVLYLKSETYLTPPNAEALVDDGVVSFIKYAVVRADPGNDDFLSDLLQRIDPHIVVSGIGEQPAPVHMRRFGLQGFTSGLVCIAPAHSSALLKALQAGDEEHACGVLARFRELEELRNRFGPIQVLHEAVRLAGIADTGPILPNLCGLEADEIAMIADALKRYAATQ